MDISRIAELTYEQALAYLARSIEKIDGIPRETVTRDMLVSKGAAVEFHRLLVEDAKPAPRTGGGLIWDARTTADRLVRQLPLLDLRR